jgi:hypothetical protein
MVSQKKKKKEEEEEAWRRSWLDLFRDKCDQAESRIDSDVQKRRKKKKKNQ